MKNKIKKISGLSYINWTWQQYNNVALRSVITNVFAKVGNNTYLYKDYVFKMEGKNFNNNNNNKLLLEENKKKENRRTA